MKSSVYLALAAFLLSSVAIGCKTNRFVEPAPTLAQMCADSFPCGDTIIYVQVDVPVEVEKLDTFTVHRVETVYLPGDSIRTYLTVPGRNIVIRKTVMVPAQIDSALRVAHRELEEAYVKAIRDLRSCQDRAKDKGQAPEQTNWLTWVIAGAFLGLVLIVLVKK